MVNSGPQLQFGKMLDKIHFEYAQVVKLVDTLASGASDRKVVEVQVLSWAPIVGNIPILRK